MELAICDDVLVAKHNRYKCYGCKKKIKIGLPVVRKGEFGKFGYQSHSYCNNCYNRYIRDADKFRIKNLVERNKHVEKEFKKIMKSCTKGLIIEQLEEQKANGR